LFCTARWLKLQSDMGISPTSPLPPQGNTPQLEPGPDRLASATRDCPNQRSLPERIERVLRNPPRNPVEWLQREVREELGLEPEGPNVQPGRPSSPRAPTSPANRPEHDSGAPTKAVAARDAWRVRSGLSSALQAFRDNATPENRARLNDTLFASKRAFAQTGSYWTPSARDTYFGLRNQADRALAQPPPSAQGGRAVERLQVALGTFKSAPSAAHRSAMNDALAEANSQYRETGRQWSPQTQRHYQTLKQQAEASLKPPKPPMGLRPKTRDEQEPQTTGKPGDLMRPMPGGGRNVANVDGKGPPRASGKPSPEPSATPPPRETPAQAEAKREVERELDRLEAILENPNNVTDAKGSVRALTTRVEAAATANGVSAREWLNEQNPQWQSRYNQALDRFETNFNAHQARVNNADIRPRIIRPGAEPGATGSPLTPQQQQAVTSAADRLGSALDAQPRDAGAVRQAHQQLLEALQAPTGRASDTLRQLPRNEASRVTELLRRADAAGSGH
jgi:hypothetical protein